MPTRHIPVLTIGFLLAIAGLYWIAPDRTPLYFCAADIAQGEAWRLVTGHFTHADLEHLFWNGLGLAVLGTMIERRSASLLWVSLGTGVVSVNVLLLSPFSQVDYYCGLSGVLNTLLVVVLWLEWRASRSWLVAATALACLLKVVIEISLGTSVLTNISWPPYAWSHAAGLVGGLTILWAWSQMEKERLFPKTGG
jgi:rhomboid family GlyGly-CTERM serine protease